MFSVWFSLILYILICLAESETFSDKNYGGTDVMCIRPVVNIAWI